MSRFRHRRFASGAAMLVLSVLNLLGAFLAIISLGGLGAWSATQFIGAFGFLEAAIGIALIYGPNIWRLPVAQLRAGAAVSVRLAPDVLFVPQPAALPKVLAGAGMLAVAASAAGVDWRILGLLYALLALALAVLAFSLIVARAGVARPERDVVSLIVRRAQQEDREIGPFSLGGVGVQLLTQVGIFP